MTTEADQIARHIARYGVTHCPTVYLNAVAGAEPIRLEQSVKSASEVADGNGFSRYHRVHHGSKTKASMELAMERLQKSNNKRREQAQKRAASLIAMFAKNPSYNGFLKIARAEGCDHHYLRKLMRDGGMSEKLLKASYARQPKRSVR